MPTEADSRHVTTSTLAKASAALEHHEASVDRAAPSLARTEKPPPLGSLPASKELAHITPVSGVTPKAQDTSAREALPGHAKRKGSNSQTTPVPLENSSGHESDAEVTDGATANPYDGDVEFAARTPMSHQVAAGSQPSVPHTGAPTLGIGISSAPADVPSRRFISSTEAANLTRAPSNPDEQRPAEATEKPVPMSSVSTVRNFVHQAVYEPDPKRPYRINPPPDGGKNPARPVRIYADGVYDLFHYAHALQLRQAKLSFPCVHLIVGIVSSELCEAHKNAPVMTSQERYMAVRNCKWVDEVVEDAPWVITQELVDKLQIDYVAHDELPYAGAGSSASMSDVYQFVKDQGRFLPTQRTDGVSTSELLARIVEQYRNHNYDKKLAKIGHEELAFH